MGTEKERNRVREWERDAERNIAIEIERENLLSDTAKIKNITGDTRTATVDTIATGATRLTTLCTTRLAVRHLDHSQGGQHQEQNQGQEPDRLEQRFGPGCIFVCLGFRYFVGWICSIWLLSNGNVPYIRLKSREKKYWMIIFPQVIFYLWQQNIIPGLYFQHYFWSDYLLMMTRYTVCLLCSLSMECILDWLRTVTAKKCDIT